MVFNPYYETVNILMDGSDDGYTFQEVQTILEDANSPVAQKLQEKLFQYVIEKGHIDFGDIAKSAGDIKSYVGYKNMVDTLDVLNKLAIEERSNDVLKYVKVVQDAISNIAALTQTYTKGFRVKSDYVMIEYNSMVYTCVEATSSLLYEFVDYVKRPDMVTFKITLKNTKMRANLFYIEQLVKFNNINDKMLIEHRKMLETMCDKNKEYIGEAANFIVGMAAIAAIPIIARALLAIIRGIISVYHKVKGKISDALEMQALFLEMNKSCIEANDSLTIDKKKSILAKQEKLKKIFLHYADKFKVRTSKAIQDSKRELAEQNKTLTIDGLKDEISNSPLEIV